MSQQQQQQTQLLRATPASCSSKRNNSRSSSSNSNTTNDNNVDCEFDDEISANKKRELNSNSTNSKQRQLFKTLNETKKENLNPNSRNKEQEMKEEEEVKHEIDENTGIESNNNKQSYCNDDEDNNSTMNDNEDSTRLLHKSKQNSQTANTNTNSSCNSSVNSCTTNARANSLAAKLVDSQGAELRRALFSLRQTFDDDKQLALKFANSSDCLDAIVEIARKTCNDQISQNYILRAIAQLLSCAQTASALSKNSNLIRWLYSLLLSQFRLVARAALKLLLQFVASVDTNYVSFCNALKVVSEQDKTPIWSNVVHVLHRFEQSTQDADLLVDAMKLVNKTLACLPDQDSFYDFVDPLEGELEFEACELKLRELCKSNDALIAQLDIYAQVLRAEDEDDDDDDDDDDANEDDNENNNNSNQQDYKRRRSKRFLRSSLKRSSKLATEVKKISSSTSNKQQQATSSNNNADCKHVKFARPSTPSSTPTSTPTTTPTPIAGSSTPQTQTTTTKTPTRPSTPQALLPSLARRQTQRASISSCSSSDSYGSYGSGYVSGSGNSTDHENRQRGIVGDEQDAENDNDDEDCELANNSQQQQQQQQQQTNQCSDVEGEQLARHLTELEQLTDQLAKRSIIETTDKRVAAESKTASASTVLPTTATIDSLSSLTSSELSTSNSSSTSTTSSLKAQKSITENQVATKRLQQQQQQQQLHLQQQQAPFQWEQLVSRGVSRPLLINGLDFTDLADDDEDNNNNNNELLNNAATNQRSLQQHQQQQQHLQQKQQHQQQPPPPPPQPRHSICVINGESSKVAQPPPPPPPASPWMQMQNGCSSPTPSVGSLTSSVCNSTLSINNRQQQQQQQQRLINNSSPLSCSTISGGMRAASSMSSLFFGNNGKLSHINEKRKKTMKLFWKEVRDDNNSLLARLTKRRTIWDEIVPVEMDTQRLEYLFESKAKDLMSLSRSRLNGFDSFGSNLNNNGNNSINSNQRKAKIVVLDAKRSNAINIGMTKLPPMRTIKNAILKMDSTIMNREGIEKIMTTMMPSEEEKQRIIEAQLANPDAPLGTAEQFLLNLASISALEARLKLWAFQLDYAQIEKEVAEPLMDLKQAIHEIESSKTFKTILGTLLAIGNFLNCSNAKGFQLEYLEKVAEVKDTVHKHSLLHHLCVFMVEKFGNETGDLYSEFSAVNRASKVDYADVAMNLKKIQSDCKASWDYLKIVAKHDGLASLMNGCSPQITSSTNNNNSNNVNNSRNESQLTNTSGKINNLSRLSMITAVIPATDNNNNNNNNNSSSNGNNNNCTTDKYHQTSNKQMKTKVSDFLADCAERIMVLVVVHRRVMNRFQKLLSFLGCPQHSIKQTQPQQLLKIINEFALEYRTQRERVCEMFARLAAAHAHHCPQHPNRHLSTTLTRSSLRWQSSSTNNHVINNSRLWAGSQQSLASSMNDYGLLLRPGSSVSSLFGQSELCTCKAQSPANCEPDYATLDHYNYNGSTLSLNHNQHQQQQQQQQSESARREEQLRRLLISGNNGSSLDSTNDRLASLESHWATTVGSVSRTRNLASVSRQRRAMSIDEQHAQRHSSAEYENRQSSYYRHLAEKSAQCLPSKNNSKDDDDDNYNDDLVQNLVESQAAITRQQRAPISKNSSLLSSTNSRQTNSATITTPKASGKLMTGKALLSRLDCERRSIRRPAELASVR